MSRLRWIVAAACCVAALYVPTLGARFDFVDDGNLVYPAPAMDGWDRIALVATKIRANYEDLGAFRPVLWVHWEAQAELFGASERAWRAARLAWTVLAVAAFLWLLLELGIDRRAALASAAIAFWNPWRNEVWRSLTLSEGVAMPYALAALALSARAARSERPFRSELGAIACTILALGCKNTFVALIPAEIVLRVARGPEPLAEAVRRRGPRALALALPLVLPAAHLLLFLRGWHPGQYEVGAPTWAQLGRMLRSLSGAVSLEWIAPALALGAWAVWRGPGRHRPARGTAPFLGGLALLVAGIAVYLPFCGVAGRYSMPAVWGLDLWIARLLDELVAAPPRALRRAALGALCAGIVAIAVANLGKQDKAAARSALLWQAVEAAEAAAPAGATLGWIVGPRLGIEEGIHAGWHLRARRHGDWRLRFFDAHGAELVRRELPVTTEPPALAISGERTPPAGAWRLARALVVPYRLGFRGYQAYLWSAVRGGPGAGG